MLTEEFKRFKSKISEPMNDEQIKILATKTAAKLKWKPIVIEAFITELLENANMDYELVDLSV